MVVVITSSMVVVVVVIPSDVVEVEATDVANAPTTPPITAPGAAPTPVREPIEAKQ